MNAWFYLILASIFEIGWPVGLKLAGLTHHKVFFIMFSIIAMGLSGIFLYIAQKNIPIGTAYCAWTGLGAIGTFIIGVIFFHDVLNLMRFLGIIFVITGLVLLKNF